LRFEFDRFRKCAALFLPLSEGAGGRVVLGLTAVGGLIFMAMDGLYGVFAGAKNGYGEY
jgi:hypothetical protein